MNTPTTKNAPDAGQGIEGNDYAPTAKKELVMCPQSTETINQPATPMWAKRTEVDDVADQWAWDPSAPIGRHVAAEYDDGRTEVRVEQMFQRDGSATTAPYIYIDSADSVTAEQARNFAAALLVAAEVIDRL